MGGLSVGNEMNRRQIGALHADELLIKLPPNGGAFS
jgi:hypothetical protein